MKLPLSLYPKTSSPCNCLNLRRATRAVTQFYDDCLEPCGLTITQLGVLRHIAACTPPTISAVAKRMRIDRTTLNRNLKPLLECGFIAIHPGADSRTRLITLTSSGQQAMDDGGRLWEQAQTSLQDYLGDSDLAKLSQLLLKLEALVP